MKAAIISLLWFVCVATAGINFQSVTPADLAKNGFELNGKTLALVKWKADYQQVSPSEYIVAISNTGATTSADPIIVKVPKDTALRVVDKRNKGKTLYITITGVIQGKPAISILGTTVGFDINNTPKFGW